MPAMDEAGNIYLAETGMGHMWKYSPPFPTSEADCPGMDHLVTTAPTKTLFPVAASPTPAAIVRVPGTDHWYVSSVLLPGVPGQGGDRSSSTTRTASSSRASSRTSRPARCSTPSASTSARMAPSTTQS